VSTTDVYGYPVDARICDESRSLNELALHYNKYKCKAEKMVWKAHHENGLPITILRPSNIFGPRGKDFTEEIADLLDSHVMMYVDGGRLSVGLIYVDNAAHAIIEASLSSKTIGEAYNLVDEDGDVTWKSYVEQFSQAIGASKPWIYLPFSVAYFLGFVFELIWGLFGIKARPLVTRHAALLVGRDQYFPNEKAKKDFGMKPLVSFQDGLQKSAQYIKERRFKNKK